MIGWKASSERAAPRRLRLRWSRVATLAAVLLIHLSFLAFLLAPPPGWRWQAANESPALHDTLLVRLLPARIESPRPAVPSPRQPARATPVAHRPSPVALPTRTTPQAMPPPATPRSIDSLIATAPPDYVAGGGRLSGPGYGRQNVRVPGSGAPVRGMPVFRMVDPRMQGVAGAIRFIGHLTGAVDPHCLQLDAWQGMSPQERIANHVDADDAQMAAIAARYGCSASLKPGATMYYYRHPN